MSACELIVTNLRALLSQNSKFLIGMEYLPLPDISGCEASDSSWGFKKSHRDAQVKKSLYLAAKHLILAGEHFLLESTDFCFYNIS